MANYSQISYGSKGSDVTELQKLLNQNGYSLDVDGVYGSKTQAAVKDYQKKNSLTVDGIVGTNTWGALTGSSSGTGTTTAGSSTSGAASTGSSGFSYADYTPSDTVAQAEALLQQQMANKPGEYQSQYSGQISQLVDQILNRDAFSYDVNADALYQQLTDQYVQQGRMAMMDTMGQAAALTGGYGNSYAQSVGQQAYQQQLQSLNEMVPDLYQMALNQYLQEGEALYDQVSLLGAQDEQAYNQYRDSVSDYYADLERLYSQYNTERDYDYSTWADGRDFAYGQYSDDRAYAYQAERDAVADAQWQAEFDEAKRQYDQSYALSASKSSSSGSSSSKSSSSSSSSTSGKSSSSSGATGSSAGTTAAEQEKEEPTFGEIGEMALAIAEEGGDPTDFLVEARQAGIISYNQYKSLMYTFGY